MSNLIKEYHFLLEKIKERFPGFQIRYKSERPLLFGLLSFLLRSFSSLFKGEPVDLMNWSHLIGSTLWVSPQWERLSWRNKLMVLRHEWLYIQATRLTPRGEVKGTLAYIAHLFRLIIPPVFWNRYRQWLLEITWQTNVVQHVSKHGRLPKVLVYRYMEILSGPLYLFAFKEEDALSCIYRMEKRAKDLGRLFSNEGEDDGAE